MMTPFQNVHRWICLSMVCALLCCKALASVVPAPPAPPTTSESLEVKREKDFHDALWTLLVTRGSPRELIVATCLFRRDTAELLRKAARDAPDDALVQRMHAIETPFALDGSLLGDRGTALRRIEPDNATAWDFEVYREVHAKNEAGIDATLAAMAKAQRADDHVAEAAMVVYDTLLRLPGFPAAIEAWRGKPQDVGVVAAVLAESGTRDLTPFGGFSLPLACTSSAKSSRKQHCVRLGRLFLQRSNTLSGRHSGAETLRNVGALTSDDKQTLREAEWLWYETHQPGEPLPGGLNEDAQRTWSEEWLLDWKDSNSEFEAARRHLRRHGRRLTPPSDWLSPWRS